MEANQTCAIGVDPPDGYASVVEGHINAGDMIWNESYGYWEEAAETMVNDDVTAYYGVARKQ